MNRTRARRDAGLPSLEDEQRWAAVIARDAARDDDFVYSVATTGVYCLPSCGARRPKRENVAFHATCADAEAAGFRPCKRCRPAEPAHRARDARIVTAACRAIESADEPPSLAALARAAGLSPSRFHRVFKAVTGMTPKGFALAHRSRLVRDTLKGARTVTEAIHQAGFASSGRFYATAREVIGMTPGELRAGGAVPIRFSVRPCSLGHLLVAASEKGVCAILLGDTPEALIRDLEQRFPKAHLAGADRDLDRLAARVLAVVEEPGAAADLPLDLRGSAFQHRVWHALRGIGPGTTASYTDIARRIGEPRSARAVASACAANPLAVVVPCHRVVRADGSLSGYRWGIERKRALLDREARPRKPR